MDFKNNNFIGFKDVRWEPKLAIFGLPLLFDRGIMMLVLWCVINNKQWKKNFRVKENGGVRNGIRGSIHEGTLIRGDDKERVEKLNMNRSWESDEIEKEECDGGK